MAASTTRRRIVGIKAATKRHHPDVDTTDLDRDLAAERLADYIERTVTAAPPLTAAQCNRLATLLRGPA